MVGIMDDGLCLSYIKEFVPAEEQDQTLKELLTYPFEKIHFKFGDTTYVPQREMCAFGDENAPQYKFSGLQLTQNPWTPLLLQLKDKLQKETHHIFNSAILNLYPSGNAKISKHQDNERCLDSDVSVCAISLGSTRTLNFSRPGFMSRKVKLESGSLLIMHPPSNKHWFHCIDAESEVDTPRISVTFRKVVNETPIPRLAVKRKSDGNTVETDTSTNMTVVDIFNGYEDLRKIHLGEDIYLSLTRSRSEVKLHLRKFYKDACGLSLPSREGITFAADAWYEFSKKFSSLNLYDVTSSFICNNELAVLNYREEVIFQTIRGLPKKFNLSSTQFEELSDSYFDFTDDICEHIIGRVLPLTIEKSANIVKKGYGCPDDFVFTALLKCIESDINRISSIYLKCIGCEYNHPSQFRHECLTLTFREKFEQVGSKSLIMLNCEKIASDLCAQISKFNPTFFEKRLSAQNVSDNVFMNTIDNPFEIL